MDGLLQTPQIQLSEMANYITNATGSAFGPQTLRRATYRPEITPHKVNIKGYFYSTCI